jgi:hypothetical protein
MVMFGLVGGLVVYGIALYGLAKYLLGSKEDDNQ